MMKIYNGNILSNKDMYKLGKHAGCQNVLKNKLSLIEQTMKKTSKQKIE